MVSAILHFSETDHMIHHEGYKNHLLDYLLFYLYKKTYFVMVCNIIDRYSMY